jgi:MoaA/NifB/PqqE/SkfB family radical SAM enzyme
LQEALQDKGVELRGNSEYLRRIDASVHDLKLPVDDCKPGEDFLFIDEIGRIAPCSFTTSDYGISIDDLKEAEDLVDLPARLHSHRRQCRATACEDCQSTHVFEKFTTR